MTDEWTKQDGKKPLQLIPEEMHQRTQHTDLLARDKADLDARKNHNFVQVGKSQFKELRGLIDRNHVAAKLLLIMGEKMNRQNALICSFKTLCEITGLSRSTLSTAIAVLKQERWIEVLKIGTANAYIVNSRVFWTSTGVAKHATFNATIIASSTEQDQETWDSIGLRHFPFLEHGESDATDVTPPKPKQKDLLDDYD